MSLPTAQSLAQKLVLRLASADRHVAAAVDMFIEHEYWLTNPQFVEHCVHLADDGGAYIQWGEALRLYNEAAFAYSSTTGAAVLDLAIALGTEPVPVPIHGRQERHHAGRRGDRRAEPAGDPRRQRVATASTSSRNWTRFPQITAYYLWQLRPRPRLPERSAARRDPVICGKHREAAPWARS
jgi:hypothetical protein